MSATLGGATIAGNGTADPADTRYYGQGTDQPVSPRGAALTLHNGLVFTSGHVVYRMVAPAQVVETPAPTTVPST